MTRPQPTLAELTVVFPTFNSESVIGRAVSSVPRDAACVIADNASDDATIAAARAARPDASIVRAECNRGFGAACNMGVAGTTTPWVALVNPDLFLEPGCLERCLEAAAAKRQVALFGLELRSETASDATLGHVAQTNSISGAFMLFRRCDFDSIGGFDEDFFLYFEDEDLCLRARCAGLAVGIVTGARARHLGGQSTRSSVDVELGKAWLWGAACQHFAHKHAGLEDGRRAARKLRRYFWKLRVAALLGRRRRAALLRETLAGAAAVRRQGPQAMQRNAFVR